MKQLLIGSSSMAEYAGLKTVVTSFCAPLQNLGQNKRKRFSAAAALPAMGTKHPLTTNRLAAGKAVLCEKPFTINAREAAEVIAFARARRLFLMAAMWTRCFPLMDKLRELLATQAIGTVRGFVKQSVQVVFCFGFCLLNIPGVSREIN